MLSILIIVFKPNRTQSSACFKIRKQKLKVLPAFDNENKIFSEFSSKRGYKKLHTHLDDT